MVRPTGPYDPDLYVLALRRPDGKYGGLAFNHSVHNIGHVQETACRPVFMAWRLGDRAAPRCHDPISAGRDRITQTSRTRTAASPRPSACTASSMRSKETLVRLRPALPGPVQVLNRQFTYHVRRFDEAKEAVAVKSYLEKYLPTGRKQGQGFRKNARRDGAAPGRGRHTRIQIVRLGDLALVGIPGEMFARLRLGASATLALPAHMYHRAGQRIDQLYSRPQSVCRRWLPDLGGLAQHVGSRHGEAMVDQVVAMLDELYDAAPPQRRGTS